MPLGGWDKINEYTAFGAFEVAPQKGINNPCISRESFEDVLDLFGVGEIPEYLVGGLSGFSFLFRPSDAVDCGRISLPQWIYRRVRNKQLSSDMDYWTPEDPLIVGVMVLDPQHPAGRVYKLKLPSMNLRNYMESVGLRDSYWLGDA